MKGIQPSLNYLRDLEALDGNVGQQECFFDAMGEAAFERMNGASR